MVYICESVYMRKVTQRIREAFHTGSKLRVGNTYTDGKCVWLFGNKIVERRWDGVYFTLAGWNTITTRERVNGILGITVYTRKGQPFMDRECGRVPIDLRDWVRLV